MGEKDDFLSCWADNCATWVDIEQNTDEWLALRMGRVGGSTIGAVMANFGKKFGDPAHDAAVRIAIEKVTGIRQESKYSNSVQANFARGHEEEPLARAEYEAVNFCEVTNGGYFAIDDIMGCSPDGLVDDDGMIEIKSRIATVHVRTIERGNKYSAADKWQLIYNLKCASRDWIDYVEYCSAFPINNRISVFTLESAGLKKEFGMIDERMGEFKELVAKKIAIIKGEI